LEKKLSKIIALRNSIALLIVLLVTMSCKEEITNIEEPPAGRRDYVWTADTIKVPFTYFSKIWGDAPDNVWIVGPGGGLDKTIWHFDGTKWSTDGISRGISPLSVWGFGKNNVWIAGYEGHIWHYSGIWKESVWFKKNSWNVGFTEIYGDAPSNIYAIGYADSLNFRKGIILMWNGEMWKEVDIPVFTTYGFITMRKSIAEKSNYYILGWGEKQNGGDLLALFEFDGANIKKIYEADFTSETWTGVTLAGDKLLFIIGNKICKYTNSQFQPLFEVDLGKFNQGIWCRDEKDVLISMKDGIAHYNGTDIEYLYRYKGNEHAFGATVLEKDVFILTTDSRNAKNILIRGKLP
jgi:hypothetical protein